MGSLQRPLCLNLPVVSLFLLSVPSHSVCSFSVHALNIPDSGTVTRRRSLCALLARAWNSVDLSTRCFR